MIFELFHNANALQKVLEGMDIFYIKYVNSKHIMRFYTQNKFFMTYIVDICSRNGKIGEAITSNYTIK